MDFLIKTAQKVKQGYLLNNPSGSIEAEEQRKTILKLSEAVGLRPYNSHLNAAILKILSHLIKYPSRGKDINLFDYLSYMLNANIDIVKKEQTKEEYRTACKIINMLKNSVPIYDICIKLERM